MNKSKKLYPFKFEADCRILNENSVIANGFLSENSIDDVLDTYLGEIVGNDNFQYYKGIFPIKITVDKIEKEGLPLQAHPDNLTASERYMAIGKAKLWHITKSSPSTVLYMGFEEQMDAERFYNGCIDNTIIQQMHMVCPKAGDYIYIKPGCVHAVKGELEFIEISQNSDITYHLTGDDAAMEIAEAIDVVGYTPEAEEQYRISGIEGDVTIANTSGFIVKHIALTGALEKAPQESFIIYICLNGQANIKVNGTTYDFKKGEMVLVPAGMDGFVMENGCDNTRLLEVYLPKVADIEEDLYMNYYEDESNYPTGSGTDPEEDEEEDDECGCGCGHSHHHDNCGEGHHHNCGCAHDHDCEDDHGESHRPHPGELFFRN